MLFLTRDRLAAAFLAAIVAASLAFAPSAIAGEPGGDGVVEKLDSTGARAWQHWRRRLVLARLPAARSAPLPGNEERILDVTCAEVLSPQSVIGGGRWKRTETCIHPDDTRARYIFAFDQDCSTISGVALVAPEVRALIAVLGDGRVRRLRLRRLPAGYGDWRAAALVLGRSTALRRLVAVTRGGDQRVLLGSIGPGAIRWCGGVSFTIFMDDEPATPHGPATLTVYDEGVRLCATLGRRTRQPGECRHVPIDAKRSWILTRRAGGAEHVAGIVSADVAKAAVELVGGRRVGAPHTFI